MQYNFTLNLEPDATFNNFFCASHYEKALLDKVMHRHTPILLIGEQGSGKTHLLQAACHHKANQWLYLDGKKVDNISPSLLENLQGQLICLDNLEYICQQKAWQDVLFKLVLDNQNSLLFSASSAFVISERKDLQSRIQAMLTLKLPGLDEKNQAKAILHKSKRRGFPLEIHLIQWLQKQLPRDNGSLFSFINHLETESSRQKKKPSIHLAKTLLSNP